MRVLRFQNNPDKNLRKYVVVNDIASRWNIGFGVMGYNYEGRFLSSRIIQITGVVVILFPAFSGLPPGKHQYSFGSQYTMISVCRSLDSGGLLYQCPCR